jgi:hypothetical protein
VVHIATYKSVGYDLFARTCSAVRALLCARIYGDPANYRGGGRSFESPRPHDSFKNT